MKNACLLFLILSFSFLSCERETAEKPQVPLEEALLGDWQVIYQKLKSTNFIFEDQHEGVVTHWGCYYVLNLRLNSNGTYFVNETHLADVHTTEPADNRLPPLGGSWALEKDQLYFTCQNKTFTGFKAHINKEGKLVLENGDLLLLLNKKL